MRSQDVLPVLAQYAYLLVPLIIAVAGWAITQAAAAYNAHVKNQRVRDTVSTIVKAAEMTIAGSAEKKAHTVDTVRAAFPFLSATQAGQLVEAAVWDINQWQAQTGSVPPPQQAPSPVVGPLASSKPVPWAASSIPPPAPSPIPPAPLPPR